MRTKLAMLAGLMLVATIVPVGSAGFLAERADEAVPTGGVNGNVNGCSVGTASFVYGQPGAPDAPCPYMGSIYSHEVTHSVLKVEDYGYTTVYGFDQQTWQSGSYRISCPTGSGGTHVLYDWAAGAVILGDLGTCEVFTTDNNPTDFDWYSYGYGRDTGVAFAHTDNLVDAIHQFVLLA